MQRRRTIETDCSLANAPSLELKDLSVGELMAAHRESKTKSQLPSVLGDGYLNDTVLVFRNLRAVFLKCGGQFIDAEGLHRNELHKTLPFAGLDEILTRWRVPFVENVSALEAFESKKPGLLMVAPIVSNAIGIKKNYLLHETSHCLIDRVAPWQLQSRRLSDERVVVLRILMGEAFANTSGALCAPDLTSKIGIAFYALNDYGYCLEPRRGDLIQQLVRQFGYRHSFKIVFFAFIALKYLATEISRAALGRLMNAFIPDLKVSRADMQWVHTLVNSIFIGHDLD